MYGRGTWYKPGFGASTAIKAIDASSPSLSVAVFAPGWTWETEPPSAIWNTWFNDDKKLWVGANSADTIPPNDDGSPYVPLCKYFKQIPPPNPSTLAFYTSFCPGSGLYWYVNGAQVLETKDGWTDLQKQTSLGDLLWPQPEMRWDGDDDDADVWPGLAMADKSWNGGNCLGLGFSVSVEKNSGRLPVQSLPVSLGQRYAVTVIFNTKNADGLVKLDLSPSVEPLSAPLTTVVTVTDTQSEDLPFGWRKLSMTFSVQDLVSQSQQSNNAEVLTSIGLNLSYSGLQVQSGYRNFSFFLGQMTVVPVLPAALDGSTVDSRILWADFSTTTTGTNNTLPTGVLTWDVTSFFVPPIVNTQDKTKPQWTLQDPAQWLPKFIYFNIYAQALSSKGTVKGERSFMGTTGLDGRAQRFFVDQAVWPDGILGASKARVYVQGVTDHGEVLTWDRCAQVDIKLQS